MEDDKKGEHTKKQKVSEKKKQTVSYQIYREKANKRNQKYRAKLSEGQLKQKREKDRERYKCKKERGEAKSISQMTDREKLKQRKIWKINSLNYRIRRTFEFAMENTTSSISPSTEATSSQKSRDSKEKAKACRDLKEKDEEIKKLKRELEIYKKRLQRRTAHRKRCSPNTIKVKILPKGQNISKDVRKRLVFGKALVSQLPHESKSLKENSKAKQTFCQLTKTAKKAATPRKAATKRQRKSSHSGSDTEGPAKKKVAKSRAKIPDISGLNFDNNGKSPSGKKWNIKISTWNVNGLRAWLEKNGSSFIEHEDPDVFCLQETKCSDSKLPSEIKDLEGYHCYWLSGDKDGYSGVGLLSKKEPKSVQYGIGHKEHDNEGRVITAEFDKFYVVNAYVPNAGRGLVRLDYRMQWDKDFRKYLKKLDAKKHVILCGDLNVAHQEIDLANPKSNKKTAGFTQEERDGFTALLEDGFSDSFRHLYPDVTGAYTYWTYMMNARAKDVGWRLDYFVLSKKLLSHLCDCVIRKEVFGSDHCPLTLFAAF